LKERWGGCTAKEKRALDKELFHQISGCLKVTTVIKTKIPWGSQAWAESTATEDGSMKKDDRAASGGLSRETINLVD